MEGRGSTARRNTKLKILAALMQDGRGVLELSRITDTSRATVSQLVDELREVGILESGGERMLAIDPRIVAVFIEIYREYTEIVTYYFGNGKCDRVQMRHVWSLTFGANVERSVITMARHIRALSADGYTVYSAAMLVGCDPGSNMPKNTFDAVRQKRDMIASYLSMTGEQGSLLYVDESDTSAALYFESKHVCACGPGFSDTGAYITSVLGFLQPSRVVIECKKNRSREDFSEVREICQGCGVELTVAERSALTPAEFALMIEAFRNRIN